LQNNNSKAKEAIQSRKMVFDDWYHHWLHSEQHKGKVIIKEYLWFSYSHDTFKIKGSEVSVGVVITWCKIRDEETMLGPYVLFGVEGTSDVNGGGNGSDWRERRRGENWDFHFRVSEAKEIGDAIEREEKGIVWATVGATAFSGSRSNNGGQRRQQQWRAVWEVRGDSDRVKWWWTLLILFLLSYDWVA